VHRPDRGGPSADACRRPPGAVLRNRLAATTGERTARLGENSLVDCSPRHGARVFWRLPRTAATILTQTLQLLGLV